MRTLMIAAGALILTVPAAQKPTVEAVAERLSGTWKINRELSPSVSAPRGNGAPRGGRGTAYAIAPFGAQRGGGGRGGGGGDTFTPTAEDLTPEEIAADAALQKLQQVAETMTLKASAESVTFNDPRGERVYPIHDKTEKLAVAGATLSVRSRWDKASLKQEFSSPKRKLVQTWEPDDSGHLVLKVHVESMSFNTPDVKAVFDRQQ
jgi:hypothetical protein